MKTHEKQDAVMLPVAELGRVLPIVDKKIAEEVAMELERQKTVGRLPKKVDPRTKPLAITNLTR